MIYFADRRDHAIPFFVDANLLPLSFLYYEYVSNLMHNINKNKAPLNTQKLFPKTSSVHTYKTRSSTSGNFYVQSTRLEIHKRSFFQIWRKTVELNEIPCSLRRLLLDILVRENHYIETPIII